MLLKKLLQTQRWSVVRVASFDYPGYTEAHKLRVESTEQVLAWGQTAMDYLFNQELGTHYPSQGRKVQRVIFGYSIGTGVAAELACSPRYPVDLVLLFCPFKSLLSGTTEEWYIEAIKSILRFFGVDYYPTPETLGMVQEGTHVLCVWGD